MFLGAYCMESACLVSSGTAVLTKTPKTYLSIRLPDRGAWTFGPHPRARMSLTRLGRTCRRDVVNLPVGAIARVNT